jgi:hypothetical protein
MTPDRQLRDLGKLCAQATGDPDESEALEFHANLICTRCWRNRRYQLLAVDSNKPPKGNQTRNTITLRCGACGFTKTGLEPVFRACARNARKQKVEP